MPQGNEGVVNTDGLAQAGAQQPITPTGVEQPGSNGQPQAQPARSEADFRYKEDRSKWVPPHRLNEESEKARKAAERAATHEAEIEKLNKRVRALAGVDPVNPEEVDAEELRNAFKRIRPDLAKLDDTKIDQLLKMAERFESIEQSDSHRWEMHATSMLTQVNDQISDMLGGTLNDRQKKNIAYAYTQRAESDPEFLQRHLRGDKSLVEEFAKEFAEDWVKPGSRTAVAREVGQARRVPSGRGTQPITTPKPKIDFTDEKKVEDAAVARFKELGGQFGS